jgi:hypothetical protein
VIDLGGVVGIIISATSERTSLGSHPPISNT